MVYIYQHCEYHNTPSLFPYTSKKYECEESREDEVEEVVEEGLEHRF